MVIGRNVRRGAALALAAAAACAQGCVVVIGDRDGVSSWTDEQWGGRATYEQTVTANVAHEAGKPVRATTRNGSVVVSRADRPDVLVTARFRMTTEERMKRATLDASRGADGALAVQAVPPEGGWKAGEGVSFEIAVPEAVPVELRSSNGRLEAVGMAGPATLRTSNGAITVRDHAGAIDADTSNGRVELEGVPGPVKAETSNGAINVRLTPAGAGRIQLETSNGAIALEVPPTYAGAIEAVTSNGSVDLPTSAPPGVTMSAIQNSRRRGTLTLGQGGPESRLKTSNGAITVKFGGS